MIRKRLGRLATVFTAGTMALLLLGVGSVAAKNPLWTLTVTRLPASVAAGQDAGFRVFIKNPGPSNINGLSITSSRSETPSYFSGLSAFQTGPTSCTTSGQFVCQLGTMRAGQSTTFIVAYTTSGSGSFDVTWTLRSSSGDTTTDSKGNSRGDAKTVTTSTNLNNSGNFKGGYFPADTTVETDQTLGSGNKQSTSLNGFNASGSNRYDIMVSDGTTTLPTGSDPFAGLTCTNAFCSNLKGEWSFLQVKEGSTQTAAFHVKIRVLASLFGNPATGDVDVLHTWIDSNGVNQETVIGDAPSERCATANTQPTAEPGCVFVSTTGTGANKVYIIDVWMFHNGGIRGGF